MIPAEGAPVLPWDPPLQARLRVLPEDFRVEELPATVPSGEGEHVWLHVRKTGHNSEDVAEWLARVAAVARGAVGYAGRKDRHALTSQWFSVHLPGRSAPEWPQEAPPGVEVLNSVRHARKLQTGHLNGNRFQLRLREVHGDHAAADAILARVLKQGLPDYFGAQRFGYSNLQKAEAWFAGRLRPRSKNQRSLYLSAARAAIFNAVLRQRVVDATWDRLLPGDLANLDGRGSIFRVDTVDAELAARCARLEIHPTGPLWGEGGPATGDAVLELEINVALSLRGLSMGLERQGLAHARRPLRMRPRQLSWEWQRDGDLLLDMELGGGEYATSVVEAIALTQG